MGLDASNLVTGGAITHLTELIAYGNPRDYGISKVIIWGSDHTLERLPSKTWLKKKSRPQLNSHLMHRSWWQYSQLEKEAHSEHCTVLFVPGGSYAGGFKPFVTMSRNLLPFEWHELRRYRYAPLAFGRLFVLRYIQAKSFAKSDGLIFLTQYAKDLINKVVKPIPKHSTIIPHGLNARFQIAPKTQLPIDHYTAANPFRLLYVSGISRYKHQWHVVEAVHILRQQQFPLTLELVGPSTNSALKHLRRTMQLLDPQESWVRYQGSIPYESLHEMYATADMGIFASSCENMPNTLLETMAAGLPVACSNRGPMPEVLGDTGLYFDPEEPAQIASAIQTFLLSPTLRREKALSAFNRTRHYSWQKCADSTFSFISDIARNYSHIET